MWLHRGWDLPTLAVAFTTLGSRSGMRMDICVWLCGILNPLWHDSSIRRRCEAGQ
jgi:hypothetical protein